MRKKIKLALMAIHPPLILLVLTAFVLFYCGIKFPETMKYFLLLIIVIISTIVSFVVKRKKKRYLILLSLIGCIALLFVHDRVVQILSVALGIFISYVLVKDSQNRYKEFESIYEKIKGMGNVDDHINVLKDQKRAWCTREAAKAAFLRRCPKSYLFAKKFYENRGYRFYHIFPDGGVRAWLSPSFWRRVGIA